MKKQPSKRSNRFKRPKNPLSESSKFPSIYRFITEYLRSQIHWSIEAVFFAVIGILLVSLSFFVGFRLTNDLSYIEKLKEQHKSIASQIAFWENAVSTYKDFRDGYFKLALLEYQRGNLLKAKVYLQDALIIDPNFEKGRELEKILQ